MHRRILVATLLAVAVTAVVLGLPLGVTALKLVEDFTRTDLSTRSQQIATSLDEQVASRHPIDVESVLLAVPRDARLVVRTKDHEYVYGTDPGRSPLTESVPMVQSGTVTLSAPSGPVRTQQFQVAGLVLLLVVLSAGTGMVVAGLTARRLADPLRHVAARAARLGAGDFRADPKRHEVPELDRVADALDASGAALSQLVQRERELVGDVSHQLRSRLTALQLRLEALADVPDQEVAEEAAAALEQAERLSSVLDDLLAAATAARARDAEPLDVSEALSEAAAEWREPLRAQGRALRQRVPDGLLARATPGRLREAIGVLLDNAVRHGKGTVTLTARHGGGTVVVEVGDAGPGVPDQLVPYVFERGFSAGGSTGVGLALARALVEADGGRLELSKARPALFEIFLPVARADDVLGVPWKIESRPR
ncbi:MULTISPECIES: ATP-binding protein [unclassified Saccharopolyspora]|uniref:ATP-binding protein n=1 Tax=unclassified Saccharopolyspora TaxID=2646250 RepID=UPI001CD1EAC2|nr:MULTISPECIES: ATP-binding protein [unclassified Saccharopolyspora]MCA1189631.1 HAMP domain-containing protein [Saccharopolyspora sp. 6T]MCA1193926.1 HAMP domain-containing protein [Saccharopolyspora sp. 6V]MCA1283318.1 HAMP domain-containing protein [Saccharopolyspora sp. 7B]